MAIDRDFLGGIYRDLYGSDKDLPAGFHQPKSGSTGTDESSLSDLTGNPEGKTDQENPAGPDDNQNGIGIERSSEGQTVQTAAEPVDQEEVQAKEEDPEQELQDLIGLDAIKHDVLELADFAKVQKLRKEQGLKNAPISMHLVFTGNPGTGKTTVARILARLYKKIGVLSKGQLVEVDRSGLVAGYVGQTAIKTQEQIQKALGGVLFIDEAYALANDDAGGSYGQEAIDTLLKAMEDHRDELVVIVAGYTKPMETFIESTPGLKSRFNKYIDFPDYTTDQLMEIFDRNCQKYDYRVDPDIRQQIRQLIVIRQLKRPENFANAREVRNLFEEIITNQARRLAAMERPTGEDMMTITLDDLAENLTESFTPETPAPADPLGERTLN